MTNLACRLRFAKPQANNIQVTDWLTKILKAFLPENLTREISWDIYEDDSWYRNFCLYWFAVVREREKELTLDTRWFYTRRQAKRGDQSERGGGDWRGMC
ncbi:unnamed protein product [Ilex paraguariensis]|uniref:Uncharacterized protein n=1 Tax=Ilex paraguariensis TaxID=185542 RepID=A0ABC8RED7_9AQUA